MNYIFPIILYIDFFFTVNAVSLLWLNAASKFDLTFAVVLTGHGVGGPYPQLL